MAVAIRERVLSAFEVMLGTVVAESVPGALTVHRARRMELPDDALPALVMHAAPASSNQLSAAVVRNVERIAVTAYVSGKTDEDLDRALADLWAALQRAVEADPTLDGIAIDIALTDADQGAADAAGFGGRGDVYAVYAVEYWTKPGDPYALAP